MNMDLISIYLQPVVVEHPFISGVSPHCTPSFTSLKNACTKSAEAGNWTNTMQVNFREKGRNTEDINRAQVSCIREFADSDDRKSLSEARKICGSTRIKYHGLSEIELGLYDHIPTINRRKEGKFQGFISIHLPLELLRI